MNFSPTVETCIISTWFYNQLISASDRDDVLSFLKNSTPTLIDKPIEWYHSVTNDNLKAHFMGQLAIIGSSIAIEHSLLEDTIKHISSRRRDRIQKLCNRLRDDIWYTHNEMNSKDFSQMIKNMKKFKRLMMFSRM